MRKLKLWIDTGFVGARHTSEEELPGDWDRMSEKDRTEFIEEACRDFLNHKIDCGGEVVDE